MVAVGVRCGWLLLLLAILPTAGALKKKAGDVEVGGDEPNEVTSRMGKDLLEETSDQIDSSYGEDDSHEADPRLKRVDVTEARDVITALVKVLSHEKSQKKLAAAREKVELGDLKVHKHSDEDTIPMDEGPRVTLMHALLPLVDELASKVLKRFGFDNGYAEAVYASIDAAHEHTHHRTPPRVSVADRELRIGMEQLSELILGEPAANVTGPVPELREIAKGFLAMSEADREEAVHEADTILARVTGDGMLTLPTTQEYVSVMRSVLADGKEFIEDQLVELKIQSLEEGAAQEVKDELEARAAVLTEFLQEGDHKRIADRVAEEKDRPRTADGDAAEEEEEWDVETEIAKVAEKITQEELEELLKADMEAEMKAEAAKLEKAEAAKLEKAEL